MLKPRKFFRPLYRKGEYELIFFFFNFFGGFEDA